jgi:predicted SAM-dependent methyltransferase
MPLIDGMARAGMSLVGICCHTRRCEGPGGTSPRKLDRFACLRYEIALNPPSHAISGRGEQILAVRKPDMSGATTSSAETLSPEESPSQANSWVVPEVSELSNAQFVDLAYQVVLGRHAEPRAIKHHSDYLETGKMTRLRFVGHLSRTEEHREASWDGYEFWAVMGRARMLVASMLPKADVIVDLGGSCQNRPEGALVFYGYPYRFKSLTIVELPREQRHEEYADICGDYQGTVLTKKGPVSYVYSSMTDLSAIEDATVDLVYSGQSIEHVTREEAITVFREVRRVLKAGGYFCFDTPNRNISKLGHANKFIVDDHKYEYTHTEIVALIEASGFAVCEAKGLVLMSRSVEEGWINHCEAIGRDRLYDDIENCFLLYYKTRKR